MSFKHYVKGGFLGVASTPVVTECGIDDATAQAKGESLSAGRPGVTCPKCHQALGAKSCAPLRSSQTPTFAFEAAAHRVLDVIAPRNPSLDNQRVAIFEWPKEETPDAAELLELARKIVTAVLNDPN